MEFNEKLQFLRNKRGLTQEELAEEILVSRTAISKWESGRGYPNIESLKLLSKFFSVSIDDLLSTEEILLLAEEDTRSRKMHLLDIIFGMLDICTLMLLFLPFFAERSGSVVNEVSLLGLTDVAPYLKTIYLILVTVIGVLGVLRLALQGIGMRVWNKVKNILSLVLNTICALAFILCLQPYAAIFLFFFLIIKTLLLRKR